MLNVKGVRYQVAFGECSAQLGAENVKFSKGLED